MGKGLYLVVDAGTTMLKAALVHPDGTFVDAASHRLTVDMPWDGWCEMDMETLWQSFCQVVGQLEKNNASVWTDIEAVGISAQGDGLWAIDENGVPVRPAILWNDTRCGNLIDYTTINHKAVGMGTTALFPGAGPVLLRWVKEHEPQNYQKIHKIFHCKDWLNFRLTGAVYTDHTDASTALLNIYNKSYEFALLELLGTADSRERFPQAVPSGEVIGAVTVAAERETCIPAGTPVIAGALDVLAVATGCQMFTPGQWGSIVGTTLCNYVVLDEAGGRENASVDGSVLCHTNPGSYVRLMAALSGTASLDWVQKEVMDSEPYPQLEAKLLEIPVGSGGLLYHPYLYGERAPFRMPGASGGWFGLRASHSKYHMARAAFEGMALSMLDCFESLPPGQGSIIVGGGAARSNFVCQMLCDCMGEKTVRNSSKELGILGIVHLLNQRYGGLEKEHPATGEVFLPNMENHAEYKTLYQKFCRLKEAMEPFWAEKTKEL